jgi:O-antigen/teichoic acid export membrane protein
MQLWKISGFFAFLSKKGFFLDTLTLAIGIAIAQGVSILAGPVLTRLYKPSDFGIFAIYSALFNILMPLGTGRYGLTILLPKEDRGGFGVLQLSALFSAVSGMVLFVGAPVVGAGIRGIAQDVEVGSWIHVLSLSVAIGGIYQSLTYWATRRREFTLIGLTRISQVSGMVVVQCLAALIMTAGCMGLVWGHVVGYVVGLLALSLRTLGKSIRSFGWIGLGTLKNLLFRYRKFPLYMGWGGLMDSMSLQLTPILLSLYFPPDVVGFYSLAYNVTCAPIALIGRSISEVLFQRVSEAHSAGNDISGLVGRVLMKQALISAFITIGLLLTGPWLFGLLFGDEWVVSGKVVQILMPMFFLQFTTSALSQVLVVLERQGLLLIIQSLKLVSTVVPLVVGGAFTHDAHKTLMFYSAAQTAAYTFYLATICKAASVSFAKVMGNLSLFSFAAFRSPRRGDKDNPV